MYRSLSEESLQALALDPNFLLMVFELLCMNEYLSF